MHACILLPHFFSTVLQRSATIEALIQDIQNELLYLLQLYTLQHYTSLVGVESHHLSLIHIHSTPTPFIHQKEKSHYLI